jgi:hypothetical protein
VVDLIFNVMVLKDPKAGSRRERMQNARVVKMVLPKETGKARTLAKTPRVARKVARRERGQ